MTADHHHHVTSSAGRLALALTIGVSAFAVTVVGASLSGSLALAADAVHQLTDVLAVGLGLVAALLARRPPSIRRTFGWHRAEVLTGALNAVLLLALTVTLVVSAVQRLGAPTPVQAQTMAVTAGIGLVANLAALLILRPERSGSFAVSGAYLEVMADALGSLAALAAAGLIAAGAPLWVDPVLALAIAVVMIPRGVRLLWRSTHVLLEGTPEGLDLVAVRAELLADAEVQGVHDLHAWVITAGQPTLTAHIVTGTSDAGALLNRLQTRLHDVFGLTHTTLQLEPAGHASAEPDHH